jgi:hypothetical protein
MKTSGLLPLIPLLASLLAGCNRPTEPPFESHTVRLRSARWDNTDWQKVLDSVLTDDGKIRFQALTISGSDPRNALFRYITQIRSISPQNRPELFPTPGDRLAYYLNAYNALCMYAVVQKGLPGNVLLSDVYVTAYGVGGRSTTLEELETNFIRTAGDPRTHFALSSMTQSSPPLARRAFEGATLDEQLDAQARRFLSDPRGVQKGKDASTVRLSELLTRFYPADFKEAFARETGRDDPDLLDALRPFAASDSPLLVATRYETMPYDWTLNRAD